MLSQHSEAEAPNSYFCGRICLTSYTRTSHSEVVRNAQPWYYSTLTQESAVLQASPTTTTLQVLSLSAILIAQNCVETTKRQ